MNCTCARKSQKFILMSRAGDNLQFNVSSQVAIAFLLAAFFAFGCCFPFVVTLKWNAIQIQNKNKFSAAIDVDMECCTPWISYTTNRSIVQICNLTVQRVLYTIHPLHTACISAKKRFHVETICHQNKLHCLSVLILRIFS